mgnify:CR=1 FL=1
MNWIKICLINILVFLLLWISIEIIYITIKKNFGSYCEENWNVYGYCKNIKYSKKNSINDGGEIIVNYSDFRGARVNTYQKKETTNQYDLIFIGDSFIQADEVDYNKTLYGLFSKAGFSTYALGYSSWNPIQYKDAIHKINSTNTTYNIFVFTNDFLPNYTRSVYGENRYLLNNTKINQLVENTLLSRIFFKVINLQKNVNSKLQFETIDFSNFSKKDLMNCADIDKFDNTEYKNKIGYDYLVYSKSETCWPELYLTAARETASILSSISSLVKELDSKLNLIIIPAGWAIENENTLGRLGNEYLFPLNISITSNPLVKFIKKELPNTNVIDVEKIFKERKEVITNCYNGCKDEYYFPQDGHWNQNAHRLIYEYLLENYIQ